MRFPALLVACLFLAVVRLAAAEPTLEFTGVLIFPSKTLLSIREMPGGTVHWIEPGRTRGGYSLVAYEPKEEIAVVSRAGETHRLRLKDAQTPAVEPVDLRQAPLSERQRVWAQLKELGGQALIEALIRSGDQTMRSLVVRIHDSTVRLNDSRAKVAEALAQPGMSSRKRATLQESDRMLQERLGETQALLEQSAVALKAMLQNSLER